MTAFLIVRRNQELKNVPLEHTIIGTTEVIGIAVTEDERDRALQEHPKSHALEMARLGQIDRLDPTAKPLSAIDMVNAIGLGALSASEFYVPKEGIPS